MSIHPAFDPARALALAHQTFEIEAQALLGLKGRTGSAFASAVALILACLFVNGWFQRRRAPDELAEPDPLARG